MFLRVFISFTLRCRFQIFFLLKIISVKPHDKFYALQFPLCLCLCLCLCSYFVFVFCVTKWNRVTMGPNVGILPSVCRPWSKEILSKSSPSARGRYILSLGMPKSKTTRRRGLSSGDMRVRAAGPSPLLRTVGLSVTVQLKDWKECWDWTKSRRNTISSETI